MTSIGMPAFLRRTPHIPVTFLPVAALATALAIPARAAAPPDVHGTYFGQTHGTNGDVFQADVNINLQVGKRISGQLELGAVFRTVVLTGSVDARGKVVLAGTSGLGGLPRNQSRIRFTGRFSPADADGQTFITGTYTVRGAIISTGTFTVRGGGSVQTQ